MMFQADVQIYGLFGDAPVSSLAMAGVFLFQVGIGNFSNEIIRTKLREQDEYQRSCMLSW
jgi:hypothetical protein